MSFGINAPEGFVDNISQLSASCNSKLRNYDIASGYGTSIFTGDPVAQLNTGFIGIGVPSTGVVGVFKGVVWRDTSNVGQYFAYWPAGTVTFGANPAVALVIDDPFVEFSIQAGTSNAGAHTATVNRTDLNLNADFVIAAGSTASGKSSTYLDMATAATPGTTLCCKILSLTPGFSAELSPIPYQNTFGQLYNNANVIFNNHKYKGGTGTAGV